METRVSLLKKGFRDVVGAEGYYMVNPKGVIISLPFVTKNNGFDMKTSFKELATVKNKNGYVMVTMSHPKKRPYAVHRIVASAFIPNPENKPYIDHIDGNPENNSISNLRWCTHAENMNNPITLRRLSSSKAGVKCYSLMKSVLQFNKDGSFVKKYISVESAAKETNSLGCHIAAVARGERRTHNGFIWEYENEENYPSAPISEDEMQSNYTHNCTVGDLLKFIEENNISMDSKIFVERVEDVYFEKHNWAVVEKEIKLSETNTEKHQYHVAWSPVKYGTDKLYLDLHY